ncbi:hypothetical protein SEA_TOKKI_72 [Arthrobacter phage Tokki]|nr:hypothetical protein SEA_TOKKI_72 [Arthrobacter phage Tokki]
MNITSKTYKRLIRRSNMRVRVFYWFGKRGHNVPAMERRIERERLLMSRLSMHLLREMVNSK